MNPPGKGDTLPEGTLEWAERLRDPDEYRRALLRIPKDKEWSDEDLENPEYAGRALLLMQRVARENAPGGVDPFKVDELDVKAGLYLGLSKEDAIRLGNGEAKRRIGQYLQIGFQKLQAGQKAKEGASANAGDGEQDMDNTTTTSDDETGSSDRDFASIVDRGNADEGGGRTESEKKT